MGNCTNGQVGGNVIKEVEISLPSYPSKYEKPFEGFDKGYNLLNRLPLFEYQLSLFNMTYTSQMRGPSSIFLDEADIDNCSVFFTNFIANHPIFYEKRDDKVNQVFVEFICSLIKYLQKGAKSFMKKKEKVYNSTVVKKFYLCIIGILFCYATPKGKADALFSMLANDNNCIEKGINNELLLYSIIFLPTFSQFLTMKDMKEREETLPIRLDDAQVYQNAFLPDKITAVYDEFIKGFFGNGEQTEVSYSDYLTKITSKELAWVLTPEGIRSKFS